MTYTIAITYGEVTDYLKMLGAQQGYFRGLARNGLLELIAPGIPQQCLNVAGAIWQVAQPLMLQLVALRVPLGLGPNQPPADTALQLVLPTEVLQVMGECGVHVVTTWQQFLRLLPADMAPERAKLQGHIKQAVEGSAGMLAALAAAGVPDMPPLLPLDSL